MLLTLFLVQLPLYLSTRLRRKEQSDTLVFEELGDLRGDELPAASINRSTELTERQILPAYAYAFLLPQTMMMATRSNETRIGTETPNSGTV